MQPPPGGPGRRPWERVIRLPVTRPERVAVEPYQSPRPPARAPVLLALGFLAAIALGSLLLALPISNREGVITPAVTALFTATSAVCVTGLVVVDTRDYWSPFGQAVILLLIQVGGLGFMTSSTLLLLLIGRRVSLRERILMRETQEITPLGSVLGLTRQIALMTVAFEAFGALVLTLRFALEFPPDQALWMGVFHSVSAFNNAGFDIIGGFRSLTVYSGDPVVLLTVALLVILGSTSFTALADLSRRRGFHPLLLDSKLILTTTSVLLAVATLGLLAMEYDNPNTLGPMGLPTKLLNAFFTAVTPRTAGFASVEVTGMTQAAILLVAGLMFIGGASGSTAGGIKVNTFAVLLAAIMSSLRGRTVAVAFGRELPQDHVYRALTIALLALALIFGVGILLAITEPFTLPQLMFEATSAFGTVGLSMGVTPGLSLTGELLIAATMYVGRLGPLTVALALAQFEKPIRYRYPTDRAKIG